MGFLQKLSKLLSGGSPVSGETYAMYYYVRCKRCGEVIKARVNLANDLSADFEGETTTGYVFRKSLVGNGKNRCFQQMEVELNFDGQRKVVSRQVTGGEFVTEEEYEAQQPTA